ncbi:c-type cytochrome [Thiohalophilus thiocyanatoxydans]|uniref:Cytochrome c553 n=1 Tax=Thiohalophilus thiocyanatoxydans TaxID=381308 RepID=A0A4R8IMB8_9GAMM|nr:c-type cytochrome [Thiohalophilus thiocyanatoxydans]TDY01568.1 cytochrome c553 [Thiohalophilus thiocyanatoxydans]
MKLWPVIPLLAVVSHIAMAAGDVETGKQIAMQGNNQGATACVACHGANGQGNASAGFPRLAGLNAAYLGKQLRDYRNGSRDNPTMNPIAAALDDVASRDVAAYYAGLDPVGDSTKRKESASGRTLALRGDWDNTIPACVSCHGPGGRGVAPAFPALAGQHASYIKAQLQAWRAGKRRNDANELMKVVAERMSDEQIQAVADYFAAAPVQPDTGAEQ